MKKVHTVLAVSLVLFCSSASADYKTLLHKQQQDFVFFQLNLAAGYDSREPNDFGLADRGPRSGLTIEWWSKDEERIQRGYTRLVRPNQWNLKIGLDFDPAENRQDDPSLALRLFDSWVRLDTKWDRTSIWLGHRSLPYGQNPKLDPSLSFLPNQAPLDFGFGRDTGFFFRAPVSSSLDLDLSVTAGGFLAGPIVVGSNQGGGGYDFEDRIRYRNSWLITSRLGRTSFHRKEFGVFAAVGSIHRASGPLTDIARVGIDWILKQREDWKTSHQISIGESKGDEFGSRSVGNLLNSFEVFLNSRWRVGMSHAFKYEDFDSAMHNRRELGTIYGMISYALSRTSRVRIHPFADYHNATGERSSGVLLQLCTGCGWRK